MDRGVIEVVGEEVTGIIAPVSICMALVVVLVRVLNPEGRSDSSAVVIASLAYSEQGTDSSASKLKGSLLNAIIFAAIVGAMTFVLFLLIKYRCYKVIYGYMGFALFNIFFFLTGALCLKLVQKIPLHVDAFSMAYMLYNFAVVGTLGLFFITMPLTLKQIYLIIVGIVVAYIFTLLPEWTSWMLLGIMALYDLIAVLWKWGPLRMLVELAMDRREELPALVYEARPVGRAYQRGWWTGRTRGRNPPQEQNGQGGPVAEAQGSASSVSSSPRYWTDNAHTAPTEMVVVARARVSGEPGAQQRGQHRSMASAMAEGREPSSAGTSTRGPYPPGTMEPDQMSTHSDTPLMATGARRNHDPSAGATPQSFVGPDTIAVARPVGHDGGSSEGRSQDEGPDPHYGLPDSIKLGLGDFIFYSMLVGRAAMYDMLTVFACYLAIIAGLGLTLLLLAVFQQALPALPISIALGIIFYFLARITLEPYSVNLLVNLVYY